MKGLNLLGLRNNYFEEAKWKGTRAYNIIAYKITHTSISIRRVIEAFRERIRGDTQEMGFKEDIFQALKQCYPSIEKIPIDQSITDKTAEINKFFCEIFRKQLDFNHINLASSGPKTKNKISYKELKKICF